MALPTLMSIDDVAKALGVSDVTITNYIRESDFPPGRRLGPAGSRRYWLESDIEAYLTRPVPTVKTAKPAKATQKVQAA